uniref:Uncharacterized protein n=1 Tax=Plectus sambesii TaxID=2011161 RepID=A0A914X5I0_9BILA
MEGETPDLPDGTIIRLNTSFCNKNLNMDLSKAVLRTVARQKSTSTSTPGAHLFAVQSRGRLTRPIASGALQERVELITSAVLKLIERHRSGEIIDTSFIWSAMESYGEQALPCHPSCWSVTVIGYSRRVLTCGSIHRHPKHSLRIDSRAYLMASTESSSSANKDMEGEPLDLPDDAVIRLKTSFSNRKFKVDLSEIVLEREVPQEQEQEQEQEQ